MSIDRLPPQDIDTEIGCIAAVLLSREALYAVLEILRAEDFYLDNHRIIFGAIQELEKKSIPVDLTTLKQYLSDKNLLEKIGGDRALASIYQVASTSANAAFYARRIKELSLRRNLIEVATESVNKCYDTLRDTGELIDEIERDIFAVTEKRVNSASIPIHEILNKTLDDVQLWYETKRVVTGTPTGFRDLDEKLTGFHGSELIILAARPGGGKTALALNMAHNIARQEKDKAVLFFSVEMPVSQLGLRLLCLQAEVESQRVRSGQINSEELKKLFAAKEALSRENIFIDDTPSINIMELRAKARHFAQQHKICLIVVDYLQLITSVTRADRYLQIGEVSRFLKQLSRELDVPVLAGAQLSRAVEKRADQRPTLADLRESGSIEQDADVVLFIINEDRNKSEAEKKGIIEIDVAKQRNGPTGSIKLKYLDRLTKFDDIDFSDDDYESASELYGI